MGIEVKVQKKIGSFELDVAFSSASGRIGVLGASGSGKSMLLKSIAGIEAPDRGRIALNGRELYHSAKRINLRPQKRRVGYLFQNYALFPNMTVKENISAGLRGKREEKRARAEEMLQKFQLSGLEDRFPGELSGGQQQRVALARIMAYEPDAILLDEPFSALDAHLKDRMQEELSELLADYEGAVILVSHARDEIYRFSKELLMIERGRLIGHGETRKIFAEPETRSAAALTGCKNFSAATPLDAHTLRADDWGVLLHVERTVPEELRFIGYRAHQLIPVWGERERNCVRFQLLSEAELPFEKNFYIRPEKEDAGRSAVITWLVQRNLWRELEERGLPDYLRLEEKDMLFLRAES